MSSERSFLIVGGGAAGLAAGVFLLRAGAGAVTIAERLPRVGKKLLVTGNGTCNISNLAVGLSHYHGAHPAFVKPALAAFSPDNLMAFFRSIGVVCEPRTDGRIYPVCGQASAVLTCLRLAFASLGGTERCDTEIVSLTPQGDRVVATTGAGDRLTADRVLVAVGGGAAASFGGNMDGYALLEQGGHRKTPLFPAVVPIKTDTAFVRAVKGIRADVRLTLQLNGEPIASAEDELLFAEYGLSGPAAMQVGRYVGDWERRSRGEMTAVIDLLPSWDADKLSAHLKERISLGRTNAELLTGLLHNRIGQTVIRSIGLDLNETIAERDVVRLAKQIKGWPVKVLGTTGLAHAQVTAGGIDTAEFDPETMASKKMKNVFAVGEVLDIDGDCGGYNLHFAFASAFLAAKGMMA